jgi:hypothetical protein
MGTYRTKPEEVEALQYTGEPGAPFSSPTPAWVWQSLASGNLTFSGFGMTIAYNGMTEDVTPGDWLVLHSDGIIRACSDKSFQTYYTPFRTRRSKAEIVAYEAGIAAEATTSPSAASPADDGVAAPPEGIAQTAQDFPIPAEWGVAS